MLDAARARHSDVEFAMSHDMAFLSLSFPFILNNLHSIQPISYLIWI